MIVPVKHIKEYEQQGKAMGSKVERRQIWSLREGEMGEMLGAARAVGEAAKWLRLYLRTLTQRADRIGKSGLSFTK